MYPTASSRSDMVNLTQTMPAPTVVPQAQVSRKLTFAHSEKLI